MSTTATLPKPEATATEPVSDLDYLAAKAFAGMPKNAIGVIPLRSDLVGMVAGCCTWPEVREPTATDLDCAAMRAGIIMSVCTQLSLAIDQGMTREQVKALLGWTTLIAAKERASWRSWQRDIEAEVEYRAQGGEQREEGAQP